MKRASIVTLTACMLALLSSTGCQTTQLDTRAQSPTAEVAPAGFHLHQDTVHFGGASGLHAQGGGYADAYPAQAYPQSCPPPGDPSWGAACPPGGHFGQAGCRGGNANDWYPQHGYSYSYSQPNDLVYPAQGAVGGVVVYPYYTHRGPTDFFME